MRSLLETNPELVKAARLALESVKPIGPEMARETTFVHENKRWWTKMTLDGHANTFERWDILPCD